MLTYLKIENVATIRELVLEPGPGLNVLTGETGAGKSVVVDALALLFGARASRERIRSGCPAARVCATFEAVSARRGALLEALELRGLPADGPEVILTREIAASGRHRIFVNGTPATLAMLQELGPLLGEVCGQHEHLRLLRPSTHLDLLDAFGGLGEDRERVERLHAKLAAAVRELEDVEGRERERVQRLDALAFQVAEIEAAGLAAAPDEGEEDEDAVVARSRDRLARAEEIREAVSLAERLLHEDHDGVVARLARAGRALEDVADVVPAIAESLDLLGEARVQVEEAGRGLAGLGEDDRDGASRLAQAEERLAELERLKRKYGPGLCDVRAHLEAARAELRGLEDLDGRGEELRETVRDRAAALSRQAERLSRLRAEAAGRLAEEAAAELDGLGMAGSRLEVRLEQREQADSLVRVRRPGGRTRSGVQCTAAGIDRAQLLLSANPGEEPRPLARVASGGEVSRVALALRTLLSGRSWGTGRTLVFDEVDAGVGGAAAARLGERLGAVAGDGDQVFCVTHLPQVAARAQHHHRVEKRSRSGRVQSAARRLEGDARVAELARMLAGRDTASARRHAAELLESAPAVLGAGVPS